MFSSSLHISCLQGSPKLVQISPCTLVRTRMCSLAPKLCRVRMSCVCAGSRRARQEQLPEIGIGAFFIKNE